MKDQVSVSHPSDPHLERGLCGRWGELRLRFRASRSSDSRIDVYGTYGTAKSRPSQDIA